MSSAKPQPQMTEPPKLVSKSKIEPPPIPTLTVSESPDDENLRSYEQAALRLFQQNFNLVLQQVAQWVATQKEMLATVDLTLGKVRAFAELAERIVQASDSQLDKMVAITDALVTLYDRIQNPPENQ